VVPDHCGNSPQRWLVLVALHNCFVAKLGHSVGHYHPSFSGHPVLPFFCYWKMSGGTLKRKI
jgi:hypothetical protein